MEFTSMEFVETPVFTKLVLEHDLEEPLRSLQVELIQNPMSGRLDPNTGGLRKIRVPDPSRNKGKRGGVRVHYLWVPLSKRIYLIFLYPKGTQESLTHQQKELLKKVTRRVRDESH